MKALLIRIGIDKTAGEWNGPVDSRTNEFVYVPIDETQGNLPGYQKPFNGLAPALYRMGMMLPTHLREKNMHLDPDFDFLTYGDQGERAKQIQQLRPGDLLVFYAGLQDARLPRLVYALVGLYEIECIVRASEVPIEHWDHNAHTRRSTKASISDTVVRAKSGKSGRLERCIPIGSYRIPAGQPGKRPCYRVDPVILEEWGGLSVTDGFLQRSARLPEFNNPARFYEWFLDQRVRLVERNN